jgi:perosamine synthetase
MNERSVAEVPALLGGRPAVQRYRDQLFHWPIITREDERAVTAVMRAGTMSGTQITRQFEQEFAAWMGSPHALATCNGTAALLAAFWACAVGAGDEIICPSMTYWASALPALMLGAGISFAEIDPETLCMDPRDIEHRIGPRTKAIVVVHYAGYPAEMDTITAIAGRHGIRVIEDVSHAHGGRYRGRMLGTIGDIGAMSMMAGKSFPVGEGGMIVTDDTLLFERCVAFGHYERTGGPTRIGATVSQVTDPDLRRFAGAPLGGVKHRMNQMCSALGRTQLHHYEERIAEIQRAMNYFWDRLGDQPGVHPHRVAVESGSSMGGWYYPQGLYRAPELEGLSAQAFCTAVQAEGVPHCVPGGNDPLHLHPVVHEADVFGMGRPTSLSFGQRDLRQGAGTLPHAERIRETTITVPWFKHLRRREIDRYVTAFSKVIRNADLIRDHLENRSG